MSKVGVCPQCGAKGASGDITYGYVDSSYKETKKYEGGFEDPDGRMGYAATCDKCGCVFVEFWKFDEVVIQASEWLTAGKWVFDESERRFAQIVSTTSQNVCLKYSTDYGMDTSTTQKSIKYMIETCVPVELQPYTDSALFQLPGANILRNDVGGSSLVKAVTKTKNMYGGIVCKILVDNEYIESDELLNSYRHRNGLPCGMLVKKKSDGHDAWVHGSEGL